MTVLAYSIANDIKESWRVVFVGDELHLYAPGHGVQSARGDSDPLD
ncbi:hypothetical protein [Mesorhizobium sp. M0085]